MQCPNGHVMPFNPAMPAGFECIFCEGTQAPSAEDLLQEPSLKFVHEVRPGQIALAKAVAESIRSGEASVYEAGTGVGKSFAYLLPAIVSGKRVVISTAKIALQNQLMQKDLPHIQSELKRLNHPRAGFKFFAAYGKSNFACHLAYRKEKLSDKKAWNQYLAFNNQTEYQRFDEWDISKGYIDRALNATNCVGSSCTYYRSCGYTRARKEVADADVVVTNNWLLGFHLRLKAEMPNMHLLGEYDHVVVDEAHKVEEGIRAAFSTETTIDTISKLRKQITKIEASTLDTHDVPVLDTIEPFWELAFRELTRCSKERDKAGAMQALGMDVKIDSLMTQLGQIKGTVIEPSFLARVFPAGNIAHAALQVLEHKYMLQQPANPQTAQIVPPTLPSMSEESQQRFLDLDKFCQYVQQAEETFNHIRNENAYRVWTVSEHSNGRPIHVLKSVPVLIGNKMPKKNITYLSATLALGTSFDNFLGRVGLTNQPHDAQVFPSPFDVQKQAHLYIPPAGSGHGKMPVPEYRAGDKRDAYLQALAEQVLALLHASEGDAFVLFTAKTELQYVDAYLRQQCYPFPVFTQGQFTPNECLTRFRNTDKATILGLKSFWEGVDVQGSKLFLVIITKLPFPFADDPIFQARCKIVDALRPGSSAQVVRVPDMLFDLRQGVGRLIRSKSDRGVIAILDPRAGQQYRHAVRAALGMREHVDLDRICRGIRTRHLVRNTAAE